MATLSVNTQLRINALEKMLPLDLRAKILAKRVEIDNYKRQLLLDAARFRPHNPHDPMFALDFKLYQQVVQSMHSQIANFEASVWAEDAELQAAHNLLKELSLLKEHGGELGSDAGHSLTGEALERANSGWLNDTADDDAQSKGSSASVVSERCVLCGRPSAGRLQQLSLSQRLGSGFHSARSSLLSAPLPLRQTSDTFVRSARRSGSLVASPMHSVDPPSGIKAFAARTRSLDLLAQSFRDQLWKETKQLADATSTASSAKLKTDASRLNTSSSTKISALHTKSRIPSPPQATSHALSVTSSSLPPTPHAQTPKSDVMPGVSANTFARAQSLQAGEAPKRLNKLHTVDATTFKTPSPATYKLTAQNLLLSQRHVTSRASDDEIMSHISMSTMVQLADSQSLLLPPPSFILQAGSLGRQDSATDMHSCASGPWDVHEFGVCRCPSVYSQSQLSQKMHRMDCVTEQLDDDVSVVAEPINVGLHLSLWKGMDKVVQDVDKTSEGATSFTGSDHASSGWSSRSSAAGTSQGPSQVPAKELTTKKTFKKGVAKLFSKVFTR